MSKKKPSIKLKLNNFKIHSSKLKSYLDDKENIDPNTSNYLNLMNEEALSTNDFLHPNDNDYSLEVNIVGNN